MTLESIKKKKKSGIQPPLEPSPYRAVTVKLIRLYYVIHRTLIVYCSHRRRRLPENTIILILILITSICITLYIYDEEVSRPRRTRVTYRGKIRFFFRFLCRVNDSRVKK